MPITAPENVIRAIAAAPDTQIRNITLAALGFLPDLTTVNGEQQRQGILDLEKWFDLGDKKEELPF